ncbi:MAG: cytidine deaminase [Kiritimatiellia bacterium]|nr:cytidine deaminase [Kiritimatiellia bacterium]
MNKKLQDQLIEKAAEAARNSYAPYSRFHVGAALLVAGKPACNARRPPARLQRLERSDCGQAALRAAMWAGSIAGRQLIITGCNVENASFGLTICAERAALAAAVAGGFRRFKAIAVVAAGTRALSASPRRGKPVVPCGACLQVLAEFCGPDFIVLAVAGTRPEKLKVYKLRDLLPHSFRLRS